MIALIDLDHFWLVLGGIASALLILGAIRKLQLKIAASPRFVRLRSALATVIKSLQNPDGSRTDRLIRAVKNEILDANKVSDEAIFKRIDTLADGHRELKAQTAAMAIANDAQHAVVAEKITGLTSEVASVKERLTAVERKLP